jgi:hypothetical protein
MRGANVPPSCEYGSDMVGDNYQRRLRGGRELDAAMIGIIQGRVLCGVEATNRCLHLRLGVFEYYHEV